VGGGEGGAVGAGKNKEGVFFFRPDERRERRANAFLRQDFRVNLGTGGGGGGGAFVKRTEQ